MWTWICLALSGLSLVLVLLAAGVWAWLVWRVRRASRRQHQELLRRMEPLLVVLDAGGTPEPALIDALASDLLTRRAVHDLLRVSPHRALADTPRFSVDALVAADLAHWLAHPNELAAVPTAIEIVHRTEQPDGIHFVLRFRIDPPHWASGDGWMIGVAGPYDYGDPRLPAPQHLLFSKLEPEAKRTPMEHLDYLRGRRDEPGIITRG